MSDIIINGQTYEGVETIQTQNTEGGVSTFFGAEKIQELDDKINNKLDKTNRNDGYKGVYGTDPDWGNLNFMLTENPLGETVPYRTATGTLKASDPIEDDDLTTKKFVEETVANAGGGGGSVEVLTYTPTSHSDFYNFIMGNLSKILFIDLTNYGVYVKGKNLDVSDTETYSKNILIGGRAYVWRSYGSGFVLNATLVTTDSPATLEVVFSGVTPEFSVLTRDNTNNKFIYYTNKWGETDETATSFSMTLFNPVVYYLP